MLTNNRIYAVPLLLVLITIIIGLLPIMMSSCSNVVDPTDASATPNYSTDPPETEVAPTPTSVLVQVPLFQPRRYIDYQAEVVCYYTPSFDISCVPGNQTKIFTYDLSK